MSLFPATCMAMHQFSKVTVDAEEFNLHTKSILQDHLGFMWFGGSGGLHLYDGYSVQSFIQNKDNPESLAGTVVYQIIEDSHGLIWAATNNGLSQYNRESNQFVNHRSIAGESTSISANLVQALIEGDDGAIWVATSNGLNIYKPETKKFRRIYISSFLLQRKIWFTA